jgi:hypothetical protein
MASQNIWVNYLILFLAILGGLLAVNLILYLFDSPFRISILFSLILTAILIAVQAFSYRKATKQLSSNFGV